MCINGFNKAVINSNFGTFHYLFCSSEFQRALERIPSEFAVNLGMRPQKGSPVLI